VNFSAKATFINSFSEDDDNPVEKSIKWVLDNLVSANDFIEKHCKSLKIDSERFKIAENRKTKTVFSYQVLSDIYGEIFNETSVRTSVFDLILSLAQIIQYDIKPVPCLLTEKMENYIFKPRTELITPPACNVVFPDETTSINFRKDYSNIPTRYRLTDKIIDNESYGYYAPKEIEESFMESEEWPRGALTDEEKLRGVIPYQNSLPLSQTISIGFSDGKMGDLVKYKSLFTNYLYHEQKYRSVPMNLEITFKPGVIPGLPALILDREVPLIGYVVGVNHNINIEQSYASTTLTLSHVRPITKKIPILSGWYDEDQFNPENITENFYEDLRTESCYETLEEQPQINEDNMIDFETPTIELFEKYLNTPDRIIFQERFDRKLPVFYDESDETSETLLDKLGLEWDRKRGVLNGDAITSIGLEIDHEGETKDVGQARRDKAKKVKERIEELGAAGRKFSKKGDDE
ncbi:MAG: hypothetical protein ACOC1X_00995, partial [Promethearchaeota archaeon]